MFGGLKTWFILAFDSESSDLDWCEPNYVISTRIAEYYNTISNVVLILTPCLFMSLLNPLAWRLGCRYHLVWGLLMLTGIASAFYHATLSLAGQLLDEFGILWTFNAALALYLPKRYLPGFLKDKHLLRYHLLVLAGTVVGSCLGCVYPLVNFVALFMLGMVGTGLLLIEMKRTTDKRLITLGVRTFILWVLAVSVWISDRLNCSFWLEHGFPYLHALWHLLIAFAATGALVFAIYVDTLCCHPELSPKLSYWPGGLLWEKLGLAVPYVKLGKGLPTSLR